MLGCRDLRFHRAFTLDYQNLLPMFREAHIILLSHPFVLQSDGYPSNDGDWLYLQDPAILATLDCKQVLNILIST